MREKTVMTLGLSAFIVLITFPVWYGLAVGSSASPQPPTLQLPAGQTKCVQSKAWMLANHPRLLSDWRNAVVRQGTRDYVCAGGAHRQMSLTKTCIGCHGSAQQFCDRCHNYVNVSLNCWNCHVSSTGQKP